MKKTILLLSAVTLLASCNTTSMEKPAAVNTAKEKETLLAADKGFNDLAGQEGLGKGMEKYYDDNVVGIGPGMAVDKSKASILKSMTEHKMADIKTMSWKTEGADVSSSGDMGYTWGHYEMKDKTKAGADTTYYGAYSTFWKKQSDGSWKAVVDHNSDTPKP